MAGFYDFPLKSLDGSKDALGRLRGKVTLAVNVASNCGLTPQYHGLENLYREIKDHDFAILGLPCNQFGGQEPGAAAEIQSFCSTNYDVSFPLTEKIEVNGAGRHALYAWLTDPANGFPGDIEWNFEKFLIDRQGRVVGRFKSADDPLSKPIVSAVEKLL